MEATYVYPGSFCPPTYGHLEIVKKAAMMLSKVIVVCSVNPDKAAPWFMPEECASMWHDYELPENVSAETLSAFLSRRLPPEQIVMIRGLRGESDADEEKKVMLMNWRDFGIDKFFFFITNGRFKDVSSSAARQAASEVNLAYHLSELVCPTVAAKLLERALEIRGVSLMEGEMS